MRRPAIGETLRAALTGPVTAGRSGRHHTPVVVEELDDRAKAMLAAALAAADDAWDRRWLAFIGKGAALALAGAAPVALIVSLLTGGAS